MCKKKEFSQVSWLSVDTFETNKDLLVCEIFDDVLTNGWLKSI